jgi:hypothetical protein
LRHECAPAAEGGDVARALRRRGLHQKALSLRPSASVQSASANGKPHCNGGRLYRNFNNIRVRSFILTGAPINSALLTVSPYSIFAPNKVNKVSAAERRLSTKNFCCVF